MSLAPSEIWGEFRRHKTGIAGLILLAALVVTSIVAVVTIPLETFQQWQNPAQWIDNPKSAMPAWVNNFMAVKLPEHQIIKVPDVIEGTEDGIRTISHRFVFNYNYDTFLDDFMVNYVVRYQTTSPLVQLFIERPDGVEIELLRTAPPTPYGGSYTHTETIFSTNDAIKKGARSILHMYEYKMEDSQPEMTLFADTEEFKVLKGTYTITLKFFLFDDSFRSDDSFPSDDRDQVISSELLLGGKVYGLLGTDELRRDLAVGIIWGTPIALFIGISVSSIAVMIGLIYGIISGYKGKGTDEVMMRANDVVYALPVLPILILLSVTVGKSIFLIVGFLIIFGWVAIAKISRSMALQIKNLQYIEAAQLMGQSSARIIFKHIFPQLLPYAFAVIAISVPAAIITEAGLSFLGLGDPTLPTWGQILHDANVFGAAARGLWWWIMPPGIMISVTGLAFVLIGTALDSIVNPKMKKL